MLPLLDKTRQKAWGERVSHGLLTTLAVAGCVRGSDKTITVGAKLLLEVQEGRAWDIIRLRRSSPFIAAGKKMAKCMPSPLPGVLSMSYYNPSVDR